MHHKAILTEGKNADKPLHAECTCQTAGDFASVDEACQYFAAHFAGLSGINTAEWIDATRKEGAA